MHITLVLPVKAHCCVSIYMDVKGPAFMSIYSLKSAFIRVQLTKEEGEKAPSPSNETSTATVMYQAFKDNKTNRSTIFLGSEKV